VTLSHIPSHSVTQVSHAINRKRYLKEKKNRNGLKAERAIHDRRVLKRVSNYTAL